MASADAWSTREQLALASCVLKSGDIQTNWSSVVKQMKQICEDRPKDFFTTKNCADQYCKLLESVSSKRKRTDHSGSLDSSVLQIVSRLQLQRIEEVKREVQADTQQYKKLRKEIEQIESGEFDNQLDSIYEQMQKDGECVDDSSDDSDTESSDSVQLEPIGEEGKSVDVDNCELPVEVEVTEVIESSNESEIVTIEPKTPEKSEETQLEPIESQSSAAVGTPLKSPTESTSALSSPTKSPGFLAFNSPTASISASPMGTDVKMPFVTKSPPRSPYGVMIESVATVESSSESPPRISVNTSLAKFESPLKPVETVLQTSQEFLEPKLELIQPAVETASSSVPKEEIGQTAEEKVPEAVEIPKTPEPIGRKLRTTRTTRSSGRLSSEKPHEEPKKIKAEEAEETGLSDRQRLVVKIRTPTKEKPETPATRMSKRLTMEDDSSNSSTVEDSTEVQSSKSKSKLKRPLTPQTCPSNFPSLDAYKSWKKSIMLVWKTVHNHKYSPTFLHPVDDKNAPGYSSIVRCPMDLTTLRKNVESGVVTTNEQFQREMLLIFVNATMYNSSKHEVYTMARDIAAEFERHMQEFLALKTPVDSGKSLRHRTPKSEPLEEPLRKKRAGSPDSSETSTPKRSRNS